MKGATEEVSGTVIAIVLIALVLGVGTLLFREGGFAHKWIEDIFKTQIGEPSLER